MSNRAMESRVGRLEMSMEDLKEIVARTSLQVERTSAEMTEFKEENRLFREEMRDFKDEMKDFKDEMRQFRDDSKRENREFNRQLGDIANKYGRLIEDLVAPSICRIMKEALGIDKKIPCIDNFRTKRSYRGDTSKVREFDVIAECLDYVLVNETKTSPTSADVNRLIKTMDVIRDYFPEFKDRKLIGAIASLFMNKSVINYASAKGILALAVGDDLMDIKNPPGFKPSLW